MNKFVDMDHTARTKQKFVEIHENVGFNTVWLIEYFFVNYEQYLLLLNYIAHLQIWFVSGDIYSIELEKIVVFTNEFFR